MKSFTAFTALALLAAASAETFTIDPETQDFEADCLMEVQAGDTCILLKGDHNHDGITRVHGREDARITIRSEDPNNMACIKGSNTQDRVFQISHDYYTLEYLCFDGRHDDDYVSTAIYVLGADKKSTKNGVTSSVTGLQLFNLEIRNWDEECVHFRYFVTHAEVTGCVFEGCGKEAFTNGGGGKVGEGIYLGTALDQVDDNKAPEVKLRSGSADNVDADVCQQNWIHGNTFSTYGNECVDVKEGSKLNLIENNICEQQKDRNSGGFGLRGDENTIRDNEIRDCEGAAVRIGGDKNFGQDNNVYGNVMENTDYGGINLMTAGQGKICGNEISEVELILQGAEKGTLDPVEVSSPCEDDEDNPGDIEHFGTERGDDPTEFGDDDDEESTTSGEGDDETPSPTSGGDDGDSDDETPSPTSGGDDGDDNSDSDDSTPSPTSGGDDGDSDDETPSPTSGDNAVPLSADPPVPCSGANCAVDDDDEDLEDMFVITTNENAGDSGLEGGCSNVLKVVQVKVEHPGFMDPTTNADNLFDGDVDTHWSVHRHDTYFTFELEEDTVVEAMAVAYFAKEAGEDRIQKFSLDVRTTEETEYTTILSRVESAESDNFGNELEYFEFFTPFTARYLRISTHGNFFNNWSAFSEFEFCGAEDADANALFHGVHAVRGEVNQLAGDDDSICPGGCSELRAKTTTLHGGDGNVKDLFDEIFSTRWSTTNTQAEDDLDNGKIEMKFPGDMKVCSVKLAFYDGDDAHTFFSLYKKSAAANGWENVLDTQSAEKTTELQEFEINQEGVNVLSIVGKGNEIGDYTKVSEVEVLGC